jgi:hypothetical protein
VSKEVWGWGGRNNDPMPAAAATAERAHHNMPHTATTSYRPTDNTHLLFFVQHGALLLARSERIENVSGR